MVNWHVSKQGIRRPVSRDDIASSRLEVTISLILLLQMPVARMKT